MTSGRPWLRPLLLISLALAAPIVPFVVLGASFEETVSRFVRESRSESVQFWLVVGALSLDILLPIPSSAVSTWAGGTLGVARATLASWLGMSLGTIGGFLLARSLSTKIARRLGGNDLDRLKIAGERHGALAIILTRALPILAEACVLLMGLNRLPWRKFLPAVLLSNLGIAATYSAFGVYSADHVALPAAVAASAIVPLFIALLVRHRLSGTRADGSGECSGAE